MKEQITRDREGRGPGFEVLHETKGWRGVALARLAAQQAMAALLDHFVPTVRARPKIADPRQILPVIHRQRNFYDWQKRPHPKPVQGRVTRQQRRYAERKAMAV